MAELRVNQRFDPYKKFKFRVKWDGRYIAGITKISPLRRITEVVNHREGEEPGTTRKSPGSTGFEPIYLERGITHDPEFEQWANKTWNLAAGLGSEESMQEFRKDIVIELYNESGQIVMAFKVMRCWVSEYQALPELNAEASLIIQYLKLENEGWERDLTIPGPIEAAFSNPP